MIRVALVAASALARAGLLALLEGHDDIQVAGAAADLAMLGADVVPNVVVVALDRAEEAPHEPLPTIVLADNPQPEWIVEALRAGVRAVLPSDARSEELLGAIRAVAAGLVALPAQDAQPVLALLAIPESRPRQQIESLTPRETEVLRMLAAGLSNKELAARLDISEHTVKFHVASLLGKLGAGTRTEAVSIGLRQGLIPL